MDLSDEQFDALITRAMDELPQEYIKGLKNVAIVMADDPTEEQRAKMHLGHNLLLGLYEGTPLPMRGSGWSGMIPDKITLFKHHILAASRDDASLFQQIKRTLWHEMAHYYGLSHEEMDRLQARAN